MKSKFPHLLLLLATALCSVFTLSCRSTDSEPLDPIDIRPGSYAGSGTGISSGYNPQALQGRLDRRDQLVGNSLQRRGMRHASRDDRYHAWFDMVMQ